MLPADGLKFSIPLLYDAIKSRSSSRAVWQLYRKAMDDGHRLEPAEVSSIAKYLFFNAAPESTSHFPGRFPSVCQVYREHESLFRQPSIFQSIMSYIVLSSLVQQREFDLAYTFVQEIRRTAASASDVHEKTLIASLPVFLRTGRYSELSLFIQWIAEGGRALRPVHLNCAISACENDLDAIHQTLCEFEKYTVSPNIVTVNIMLTACAEKGNARLALEIFEMAKSIGLIPNERTITILVTCLGAAGQVAVAEDLFFESVSLYGLSPSPHLAGGLLNAYIGAAEFFKAQSIFLKLLDNHPHTIDSMNICRLLGGLYRERQYLRIIQIWKLILRDRIDTPFSLFYIAYAIISHEKSSRNVISVLRSNVDLLNETTVGALIGRLLQLELYDDVVRLLNELAIVCPEKLKVGDDCYRPFCKAFRWFLDREGAFSSDTLSILCAWATIRNDSAFLLDLSAHAWHSSNVEFLASLFESSEVDLKFRTALCSRRPRDLAQTQRMVDSLLNRLTQLGCNRLLEASAGNTSSELALYIFERMESLGMQVNFVSGRRLLSMAAASRSLSAQSFVIYRRMFKCGIVYGSALLHRIVLNLVDIHRLKDAAQVIEIAESSSVAVPDATLALLRTRALNKL